MRVGLALGACLAALLGGCGYSRSLTPPPGAASVGVAFFANDTPVRDLERELAVELANALRDLVQSPLDEPQRADVVVTGRLVEYRRRGGIRDPENRLLESGVQVLVEAWLADGHSGERIGGISRSVTAVGYLIPEPGGEEQARARTLRHLADRVVLELFQPASRTRQRTPSPPLPGQF